MAWRVYRICGREFWHLVKELLFIYLLPLPFFMAISYLLPAASWSRFMVSLVAVAILGVILMARFRQPFQKFFFSSDGEASA